MLTNRQPFVLLNSSFSFFFLLLFNHLQVNGADAVAVLTEWDMFKTLDWEKVYAVMQVRHCFIPWHPRR